MVFIPPCVLCLALYLYYLLFSRDARAFTFQKAFSAAPSGRFRYALSAKSGTVLRVTQCHRIPYWLPTINSFVVSAVFQKTYVTQKAPRSTLPLNLTVSGQSRKAYVERGALFIGSAASRAFGVPWVCKFLW
ncbi:hypothetical protein FAEPRAA2165_02275 [Faecalibacterium duncaniae]|uniref:Uncharacterized protein n=1 Tax=Faecalibacterium duncaniae (strain DSM 17677 / JCM 31915 / A2-165) TaxID=411483 RepID=C7H7J2_FAED2|nr:hypothetical protein FAEPRAA2165_02275 [Faecalibacterium duncaniae]